MVPNPIASITKDGVPSQEGRGLGSGTTSKFFIAIVQAFWGQSAV